MSPTKGAANPSPAARAGAQPLGAGARSDMLTWARRTGWLLWLLVGFGVVTALSLEQLVALTAIDDGLYYGVLARNIAAGRGCTYDGVTRTNGFHPLWLIVTLPIYLLAPDSRAALWGLYGLAWLAQLAAMILLFRALRRAGLSALGWVVTLLVWVFNVRALTVWGSLLETPVAWVSLAAYLWWAGQVGAHRWDHAGAAFGSGVLLGLCFLARLEFGLLALAYGLVWLGRTPLRPWTAVMRRVRAALLAATGFVILAAPYLGWNRWISGRWITVSAAQKAGPVSVRRSWRIIREWMNEQWIARVQYILGLEWVPRMLLWVVLLAAAAGVAAWALSGGRFRRWWGYWRTVPEIVLFVALHMTLIVLVTPFEAAASAWYWTPQWLFAAVSLGVVVPRLPRRAEQWGLAVIALAVLGQTALIPRMIERKTMTWAKLEVADYLRTGAPPMARGMMFDSGIVTYFSERDFVGLNGLIGDFELAALLRRRRLADVAARYGAEFLVLDTPEHLLPEFADHVLYVTRRRTRFEDFREEPKPFVVYRGTPSELERIWHVRYRGLR